jgi:site-specific DNA-adenine methylase
MAKLLVSLMPTTGRRYVEPFVGRANVYWTAATELDFHEWHLNDIRTIPWLTAIRDHGHDLRVPRMTRAEYLKRWADSKQGCPYAAMLSPYLTFSGSGYGAGGYKGNRKIALTASGFQQSIRMAQNIMRATSPTLTALDYKEVLQDLGEEDLCYIDPPYIDAEVGKAYTPGDLDYREMVDILVKARFRWMLSEYDHPIYREALGAPIIKQETETRHGKTRYECVWVSR